MGREKLISPCLTHYPQKDIDDMVDKLNDLKELGGEPNTRWIDGELVGQSTELPIGSTAWIFNDDGELSLFHDNNLEIFWLPEDGFTII